MQRQSRIDVDPEKMVGKPVIRGTRIAVELVIELLAENWTPAQILENYPGLTMEDLQPCLAYAPNVLQGEKVYRTGF